MSPKLLLMEKNATFLLFVVLLSQIISVVAVNECAVWGLVKYVKDSTSTRIKN